MKKTPQTQTYDSAGVSIQEGDALVDFLKEHNPAIGGFSGLAKIPKGYKRPRLVMSTDGVGTKLLAAQLAGQHETIGIDLVAMVVNDLIVCGAKPLYFLDYFATGRLEGDVARSVLKGIMAGCREADCALVGGETAEMPGMYAPGHYDLAGFGVGVVDQSDVVDGRKVQPGDVVLGLGSSGLHSNGYSLARSALLPKAEASAKRALTKPFADDGVEGAPTLADEMLRPTRIYVRTVLNVMKHARISAMAHITGGGIQGNLVRVLPRGVRACIQLGSWPIPPIFARIATQGPVDEAEMYKVFNMGIGFILIVPEKKAHAVIKRCQKLGEQCQPIGWIDRNPGRDSPAEVLLLEAKAE